jgi:DNA polymerase I
MIQRQRLMFFKQNYCMKKLVVIDGNAILHRAWHAIPPTLTTKDGTIVNAAYGFVSILLKVIADLKPDYFIVTWDTAAKTFRAEKYADYKGTRVKQDQELYDQIPIIQKIMDAFSIPNLFLDGFEADDVIGTIAHQVRSDKKIETIIVTGDLDSLQLVDKSTKIYTLKKGISETMIYDEDAVYARYGLRPNQIIDFKALKGDPSDNIKGVAGIGEKSAIKFLQQFNTLDGIYKAVEAADEVEGIKKGQHKKLLDGKEDAYFSQDLVTILQDVPVEFSLEDSAFGDYEMSDVVEVFQEYEFKTLLSRLPNHIKEAANAASTQPDHNYTYVTTASGCEDVVKKLNKINVFGFDTETTGIRPFQDELLGMSVSWNPGESYYIDVAVWSDGLKEVFANSKIKKIAHQAKFDVEFLQEAGFEINGLIFDTKIAAYLIKGGSNSIGLKDLAFEEFGFQMTKLTELLGTGKKGLNMIQLAEQKPKELAQYAAADADYTMQLYSVLNPRLKEEKLVDVFNKLDFPLIDVLIEIERNGVLLDVKALKGLASSLEKRIDKMQTEIYKLSKGDFNIKSPKQLAEVLFDRLGLSTENIKKTKSGYSTAASELEKLAPLSPIIGLISEYRELTKLKSTYVDTLPNLVNPKTGRVHGMFNQTVAATGRLSSSDPNLQNIPIRTEEGKKIREAFIAPKGYKILACDYSQIELRVVASLAKDKNMMKAFMDGEDIHKRTAANIHDIPIDDVTKEERYAAKAINFGVIYGQGPWGLSQTAKISLADAKEFIEKYFKKHSAIKTYLESMVTQAQKTGYVQTLFGRKRYLPEINSSVAVVRSQAERIAVNMPIQGTAADILKIAMIDLYKQVTDKYSREEVKMILTVHDELIFEVRDDLLDELAMLVRDVMEHPKGFKLEVPIKVDVEHGQNWGNLQDWDEPKQLTL